MLEDIFLKQLFSQEWNIKLRRGRQRETWGRVNEDLCIVRFGKAERGESSLASYLACVLARGNVGRT